MTKIMQMTTLGYDRLVSLLRHFDGVASILLRLILAPVLIGAGWEKITGENWFAFSLDSFPFPFNVLPPELSWFLASWTEFLGGIALLLGLGTRRVAIPSRKRPSIGPARNTSQVISSCRTFWPCLLAMNAATTARTP